MSVQFANNKATELSYKNIISLYRSLFPQFTTKNHIMKSFLSYEKGKNMKLLIDAEKCTGCQICVKICPQQILEVVDKQMRIKDEARCMGCFGCEDECAANAVRLLRAPQNVKDIEIEAPPQVTKCDVAIVGAGPAGLGAAITCAKAGLDVVVFERLPNRKLSHHTDGGVLFTFPGMTSIKIQDQKISFPELDISLDVSFAKKCEKLGLLGPKGLSTHNDVPKNREAWAWDKDKFVETLIDEAEKQGAKIWFNAKVTDVVKEKDKVCGVRLLSGEEIPAKVVVTADGVFAKISEKAGLKINKDDLWYASVFAYEYDNVNNIPAGLFYLNGDMQYEENMPRIFGGIGITDVIHVLIAVMSRKKFYPGEKDIEYYTKCVLEKDKRVKDIFGESLTNMKPKILTGCRGVFRDKCNTEAAGEGVISVGDAWGNAGEIGNIPALANGVYAAKVIIEAIKKNDCSKKSLEAANTFISKQFVAALSKNKDMKLLGAKLTEEEMKQMYLFMQHMNYPIMLFGSPLQQGMMFSKFMIKNFFRFFKYPKIVKQFM